MDRKDRNFQRFIRLAKDRKIITLAVLTLCAALSLFQGLTSSSRQSAGNAGTRLRAGGNDVASWREEWLVPRKTARSVVKEWRRDPFAVPYEPAAASAKDLVLNGIVWDAKSPQAVINDDLFTVGQRVEGRTVKKIEPDRVILTDGTTDIVLRLNG